MKNKSLDLYQKRGIMQFCGGKKDTSSLTFLLLNKLDKLYVFSCLNKQAGFKKQRFPLWRTLPPFQPQPVFWGPVIQINYSHNDIAHL